MANEIGPINSKDLKLSDIKVMKFMQEYPLSVFCKYSYSEEFKEITVIKRLTKKSYVDIDLKPCYSKKLELSDAKKKDLMELCKKNLIPRIYRNFYEQL